VHYFNSVYYNLNFYTGSIGSSSLIEPRSKLLF